MIIMLIPNGSIGCPFLCNGIERANAFDAASIYS